MNCVQIREAVSARLDGEAAGVDEAVVSHHLAGCPECRAFARDAEHLHRVVRLEPAPEIPDLVPGILAAIGTDTLAGRRATAAGAGSTAAGSGETAGILRWVLVAIAVAQIAVAIPALLGSDAGLPVHTARHIGSFDIALGVGFLFAAWRPSRIPGLFPVVAALVVCLVVSALLDVAAGNTAAFGESQHVTDLAGLLVMWLIGREATRPVALA
jgi:predicted anti-sigma-YlaC factor YlaD